MVNAALNPANPAGLFLPHGTVGSSGSAMLNEL
jgi:hypothetical protein